MMGGSRPQSLVLAFLLAGAGCLDGEFTTPTLDTVWTEGPVFPVALFGAAAASYRGSIYVAGGISESVGNAGTFRLTPPATQWERLPDLSHGRSGAQLVVVGDTLYLLGGFDAGPGLFRQSTSVWAMDPESHAWEKRPDFPDERTGWSVAAAERLVMMGGFAGLLNHGDLLPNDPTAVLVTGDSSWRYRAPIQHKRVGPRAAAVGDRVYVFGGLDEDGPRADYEVYDARTDRLEGSGVFHPTPALAINVAVTVLGGRVHFVGGRGRRDHMIFDPVSDSWERGPLVPYAVGNAAAVTHEGAIWLIGGSESPGSGSAGLPAVSVYRP